MEEVVIGLLLLFACIVAILYFIYIFHDLTIIVTFLMRTITVGCSWATWWRCLLKVVLTLIVFIAWVLVSLAALIFVLINIGAVFFP